MRLLNVFYVRELENVINVDVPLEYIEKFMQKNCVVG